MITKLEKKYFHETLYTLYDDGIFEEFGAIKLLSLECKSGGLNITLRFIIDSENNYSDYHLSFGNVKAYSIKNSYTPNFQITDNDPRLIVHNSYYSSLYFKNRANDPTRLIEDIAFAIKNKYENQISLEDLFGSVDGFIRRSKMEYGLYFSSGKEIVDLVYPLLKHHQMNPSIIVSKNIKVGNYKIAYFGKSWIVFKELKMEIMN